MIFLPPPEQTVLNQSRMTEVWYRCIKQVADALSGRSPPELPVVYVSPASGQQSLPQATPSGRVVIVADESGGPTLAFSLGGQWHRATDGAVVS